MSVSHLRFDVVKFEHNYITHTHGLSVSLQLILRVTILTFRQLYVYTIQMFMYKYNSGLLPTIFGNMFKLNQDVHSYNTRQSTQIHISLATLEIRLRSVRIKGAIIWNCFNTRLNFTSYSIINYKCILKQFILHNDVNI